MRRPASGIRSERGPGPAASVNEPAIASTLAFAGWTAVAVACGLAAASLGAADALAPGGWIRELSGADPGHPRIAGILAALPEAAGAALVFGAVSIAFRRPIARSLASGPALGSGPPSGVGRVEAALAVCVVAACAVLAARNLDLPIRSDEARNFVRFASRPFGTILGDYGDPNNHILHTLLVRSSHLLLGTSPPALRLPAFLAACLTLPAVWWFVRREFGWLAAAFATAFVGASPLFTEYAANARGYTLLGLLFMVLLLCGQRLVRHPDDHVRWGLYAGATALGFFTTPVMAFPAAIAAVWMLLARWREQGAAGLPSFAVRGAWWCAAAAALTLLLYAPALMVSGADAVLFNEAVQSDGTGVAAVLANVPRAWFAWHAATPVWAQAALLLALLVGAMAPRLRSGGGLRGLLAFAVALGTGAVFLVKPVVLSHRHTIFLLLATMIIAGAGAAHLADAAFARLRSSPGLAGRWVRGGGFGALAVLVVLGCLSWWATRPGAAEHFAWETGASPNASALATAVDGRLRSGDYVLGSPVTMHPFAFHLRRLGREVGWAGKAGADELEAVGLRHAGPWRFLHAYRVGGSGPGAPARFHLVVDEAGNRSVGPPLRRRMDRYRPQYFFREGAPGRDAIVRLPGAKVYRLQPPPGWLALP